MSLKSLQLTPRGTDGWGVGPLLFGRCTTLLLGPNGSGKTPIMKAIAFCLGQPTEFPPKVLEKCSAATLTLEDSEGSYAIRRALSPSVDIEVLGPSNETQRFSDERSFSAWMLPKLGIPLRSLTGIRGEVAPPYVSVAGPMFLVDQDTGWTMPYAHHERQSFVRDQAEEVLRWMLEIPARHKAVDDSARRSAGISLASAQDQIASKRLALEALQRELGADSLSAGQESLNARRVALEEALQRRYSALEARTQAEGEFDSRVREASSDRDSTLFAADALRRRIDGVVAVQREVGAELGALEENEVAATAFRHFCGNENCQFFRRPEESYGRRVLYLKDQLKDFESGTSQMESELSLLRERLAEANSALSAAVQARTTSQTQSQSGAAVDDVRALAIELAEVQSRIFRLGQANADRLKLDQLVEVEARAAALVAELTPTRGPNRENSRLLDARAILAQKFSEWLETLRTPNVSSSAMLDEQLRLFVGGERLYPQSSHSGSTRTRIVLAFHAAVLQTSIEMRGNHPNLLVLDAPRQHELSAADLRSFVDRFHTLFSTEGRVVQLILSASDSDVVGPDRADAIWTPTFDLGEGPRYLGPSTASASVENSTEAVG
jgi:hypothetical protein